MDVVLRVVWRGLKYALHDDGFIRREQDGLKTSMSVISLLHDYSEERLTWTTPEGKPCFVFSLSSALKGRCIMEIIEEAEGGYSTWSLLCSAERKMSRFEGKFVPFELRRTIIVSVRESFERWKDLHDTHVCKRIEDYPFPAQARVFELYRNGRMLFEGILFSSGQCVLNSMDAKPRLTTYPSFEDMKFTLDPDDRGLFVIKWIDRR